MEKIKTIIVEDDPKATKLLKDIIQKELPNIQIVTTANSVIDAFKKINEKQPDLVFLDIELGEESAFDLLKELKNPSFHIIFTTAYNQYAIEAFKVAALDYLLKPINELELISAVSRVAERIQEHYSAKRIEILLDNLNQKPQEFQKLLLPSTDGYEFININEIIYCEASGNYTIIHTLNKDEIASKQLNMLEKELPESVFHRVHKSYLVNLNHIVQYIKTDGHRVVMINNDEITVASRRREEFLNRLLNQ